LAWHPPLVDTGPEKNKQPSCRAWNTEKCDGQQTKWLNYVEKHRESCKYGQALLPSPPMSKRLSTVDESLMALVRDNPTNEHLLL